MLESHEEFGFFAPNCILDLHPVADSSHAGLHPKPRMAHPVIHSPALHVPSHGDMIKAGYLKKATVQVFDKRWYHDRWCELQPDALYLYEHEHEPKSGRHPKSVVFLQDTTCLLDTTAPHTGIIISHVSRPTVHLEAADAATAKSWATAISSAVQRGLLFGVDIDSLKPALVRDGLPTIVVRVVQFFEEDRPIEQSQHLKSLVSTVLWLGNLML